MKILKNLQNRAKQTAIALWGSTLSVSAYAEGPGSGKFSASTAKQAADNIFSEAWNQIVTGFNITAALIGGIVFIVCVAVWIGAFMKIQETGKGWGTLIALVIVGIILILFTFWGLGTGSDQIQKGYK